MDYNAFLLLEGGDEDDNERLRRLYSHLRRLRDVIIKDTKVTLYDIELKIQLMIDELPSKAYSPYGRRELLIELCDQYEELSLLIMSVYFNLFDKFEDEEFDIFPHTEDDDEGQDIT